MHLFRVAFLQKMLVTAALFDHKSGGCLSGVQHFSPYTPLLLPLYSPHPPQCRFSGVEMPPHSHSK